MSYAASVYVFLSSSSSSPQLTPPSPNTVDDNSMLFGAAIMLHRLFTHGFQPLPSLLIYLTINALVCIVIYAHIVLGESTLHQIVFASMMITSAVRTSRLITTTVKDRALKRQMRVVGSWALGLFLLAYGLWNVDNQFCDSLRSVRHMIGVPWAWVLELHGWYVTFPPPSLLFCFHFLVIRGYLMSVRVLGGISSLA
jgi:dihydroceramidase